MSDKCWYCKEAHNPLNMCKKHPFKPEEPPLNRKIEILETAAERGALMWQWVWTFCSPSWILQLAGDGLLKETRAGRFEYGAKRCPEYEITESGRAFLKHHLVGVGEW